MENYSIFIQYDPVDKIYVASIPELQGCMAHGHTQAEDFMPLT
ncbi:MAG: type II toxin-antitoxin system HicB family antitoxin [Lachnospiraceae bacterium]|nr:type II toxin-antitoxin system HicB family antitoxin [Lachnospiraceae bacterium]